MADVQRFTYRDIIRHYSDGVASGSFDTDLASKRVRFYVSRLLNLASNAPIAGVCYPPADATRDLVCQHMGDALWQARVLLTSAEIVDVDTAAERAALILRGV